MLSLWVSESTIHIQLLLTKHTWNTNTPNVVIVIQAIILVAVANILLNLSLLLLFSTFLFLRCYHYILNVPSIDCWDNCCAFPTRKTDTWRYPRAYPVVTLLYLQELRLLIPLGAICPYMFIMQFCEWIHERT